MLAPPETCALKHFRWCCLGAEWSLFMCLFCPLLLIRMKHLLEDYARNHQKNQSDLFYVSCILLDLPRLITIIFGAFCKLSKDP